MTESNSTFQKVIREIDLISSNPSTRYKVFSVFDHWLNINEINRNHLILNYPQAMEENRQADFEKYEFIYINAFEKIYQKFKDDLFFYTSIWVINEHSQSLKCDYVYTSNGDNTSEEPDNVVLYVPANYDEYEQYIKNNCREINPMSDLYLTSEKIYVSFGWDLTFRLYFTYESENLSLIEQILIDSGLFLLKEGYKKDDDIE
jgi:hypothetical protein